MIGMGFRALSEPGRFVPPNVSGLIAQFIADEGITLDAGDVVSWEDGSGQEAPLLAPSVPLQPLFVPNAINGRAAVISGHLHATIDVPADCSIITVGVGTGTLGASNAIYDSHNTVTSTRHLSRPDTYNNLYAGTYAAGSAMPALGVPFIKVDNYSGAASNDFIRGGGESDRSTSGMSPGAGGATDVFSLLAVFNGTVPWTGPVSSSVIYDHPLDGAETIKVVDALSAYYGIEAA